MDEEVCPLVDADEEVAGHDRREERAHGHARSEESEHSSGEQRGKRNDQKDETGCLERSEENEAKVVRLLMMLTVSACRRELNGAVTQSEGPQVKEIDVDQPLGERIDDHHSRHRSRVVPPKVANEQADDERDDQRSSDHMRRAFAAE